MSEIYPITGIPVEAGEPLPQRRDCKVWASDYENSIQVSLFIRALRKFYNIDYQDDKSYFRIAGIHGYPQGLPWNGAESPKNTREDQGQDSLIYCTHNMTTFPTWHRPYMLLFEQRIFDLMVETIDKDLDFSTLGEMENWKKEAREWRLPYWNWASQNDFSMPSIFTLEKINVRAPKGTGGNAAQTLDTLVNPLYRYQLRVNGKLTNMGDLPPPYNVEDVPMDQQGNKYPWSRCSGTSRWGITSNGNPSQYEGNNRWSASNEAIKNHQTYGPKKIQQHSIGDLVYRILTPGYTRTWNQFATTFYAKETPWEAYLNLEFIHNNLHGFIGGDDLQTGVGHMQNVPAAAFDPIFYMHHCFIDLLLALRQTLFPKDEDPTQWFQKGDTPSALDSLTPFRYDKADPKSYFTSDDVYDWRNYHYDYDVLAPRADENLNDAAYIARINGYVDKFKNTGHVLLGAKPEEQTKLRLHSVSQASVSNSNDSEEYHDYILCIQYDRYALQGDAYTISFYLGLDSEMGVLPPGGMPSSHPNYIGSVNTFSFRAVGENGTVICNNCTTQQGQGALSTAQIVLTVPLFLITTGQCPSAANTDGLRDMQPDSVEAYLAEHLQWRAVSASGEEIDVNRLQRTKIFALRGQATHYQDNSRMSEYTGYQPMHHVTNNKPWGARPEDYQGARDG